MENGKLDQFFGIKTTEIEKKYVRLSDVLSSLIFISGSNHRAFCRAVSHLSLNSNVEPAQRGLRASRIVDLAS